MKCWIDEEVFRKAWYALAPSWIDNPTDEQAEAWFRCEGTIRVEADNGRVTFRSPHGEITVPGEVERRGVLFTPYYEFMEATKMSFDETIRKLDATDDYIETNHCRFLTPDWMDCIFDDPATAPATWEPVEPAEEEDEFANG